MKVKTIIGVANQNNSGGYFIQNEHVDMFIAIEGFSQLVMNRAFDVVVQNYSSYCECCGRRWYGLDYYGHEKSDFNFGIKKEEANCIFYHIDGTKSYCYLEEFYK
ncbi:hypothetical protein VBH15_09555 [Vagococcus fluvialis]|uniref:DUF7296 family protein n=1 Tax=Vagococcus fluvialis TaxID=2738 RepID=UPI0022E75C71|nr:hypothetical protein [Vagococcus fluvialis]